MTPALNWAASRAILMFDYMIVRDNRYTVTTRMTPALSWAAIRAILMFHYMIVRDNRYTVTTRMTPALSHFNVSLHDCQG